MKTFVISPDLEVGSALMFGEFVVICPHVKMGNGCYIGDFTHIRERCVIGNNVSIGSHCAIEDGVIIGDNVRIQSGCFLPRYTVIENDAWIGPRVCFTNDKYPNTGGKNREGVTVEKEAIIGANVTLLAGVTIGEGAVIGAGAVVTKDVVPGDVAVGNPATWLKDNGTLEEDVIILKKKVLDLENWIFEIVNND